MARDRSFETRIGHQLVLSACTRYVERRREAPPEVPIMSQTPFELAGGRSAVETLAATFYDLMQRDFAALAAIHEQEADGTITERTRQGFASFLVFWLGGPDDYLHTHGHPRLRMRHGKVAINSEMRDQWVACMQAAMDQCAVAGPVRQFLDKRFAEVADFLRNVPG